MRKNESQQTGFRRVINRKPVVSGSTHFPVRASRVVITAKMLFQFLLSFSEFFFFMNGLVLFVFELCYAFPEFGSVSLNGLVLFVVELCYTFPEFGSVS